MKKLIFILTLFAISAFTVADAPAVGAYIKSGYKITSAGTSEVELEFLDINRDYSKTVYIQVLSDSIRFSAGETINNSFGAFAAGDKVPLTIINGRTNLRYKANSSSDSFIVTH